MTITHVLAVASVSDLDRATTWYERLLGRPADARPMDTLADWHLTGGGWLQVFLDPDRAGRVAVNFAVDDFARIRRTLTERGFDTSRVVETLKGSQLLTITDPDGNTITMIGNPATE